MQSFYGKPAKVFDYNVYDGCDGVSDSVSSLSASASLAQTLDAKSIPMSPSAQDSVSGSQHSAGVPLGTVGRQLASSGTSFYGSQALARHGLAPSRLVESTFASAPPSFGSSHTPVSHKQGHGTKPGSTSLADLRKLDFGQWLGAMDQAGSMLRYLNIIRDSFDTVSQIVKTYVVLVDARKMLDQQFFEDIGTISQEHNHLFLQWFGEACGVQGLAHGMVGPMNETSGAATSSIDFQAPVIGTFGKGDPLKQIPFKDWLLVVEPLGALSSYLHILEINYDSVAQIVKTYTLPTKGGKILDLQFFDDIGVADVVHKQYFACWFEQNCGLQVLGLGKASKETSRHRDGMAETGHAIVSAPVLDLRSISFNSWLNVVAGNDTLSVYERMFGDCYDNVAQVVKTYTLVSSGQKLLDVQLFEDIGIEREDHRHLFRVWFSQQ